MRLKLLPLLLAILFLAAEAAARLFFNVPDVVSIQAGEEKSAYRISANPILGYEFKERWRDIKRPDFYYTFPATNSFGQRDIEWTKEKAPGVKRILVFGDSIVAGAFVEDLNDTIPRRLETLLRREQQNIEILNFGMTGYCMLGEVELLRVKGVRFAPDIVAIVLYVDDLENVNRLIPDFVYDRPHWLNALFLNSVLFRSIALQTNFAHFQSEIDVDYFSKRHRSAVGADNVEQGFKLLKELAEKYNFRPFVAVWPEFGQQKVQDNRGLSAPDGSDALIPEVIGARHGIPVFRLSSYFAKDYEERQKTSTCQGASTDSSATGPKQCYGTGYVRGSEWEFANKNARETAAAALSDIIEKNYLQRTQ